MLRPDYADRVYAAILGKMIGVYLGRPFEGWSHEKVMAELGPIQYYVNDRPDVELRHRKLIVTDDDLAGTFVFFRALADHGYPQSLDSGQIGDSWLNYIIEGRTVLWWGGVGTSTEQTAFMRLRNGLRAPSSGSAAVNGKTLAEQIGAQIFIDAWALSNPGNPERAAYFARQAAQVSHDGIAVEAAVFLAAMEAMAFDNADINNLLTEGMRFVSADCALPGIIGDIRNWHAGDGDWLKTRERIAAKYGYDKFGGICHMVPNHALVIMSLLYGGMDFARSMEIVCTSGWDTDCNAGNVGCLVAIAGGLPALEQGPDWRGPLADRLFLSSAEGGRSITDAVIETHEIVRAAHVLNGQEPPERPKNARFNFAFPGSVQGFMRSSNDRADRGEIAIANALLPGGAGMRGLEMRYTALGDAGAGVVTRTFAMPEDFVMRSYDLVCSPTLYPGQTVQMRLVADPDNKDLVSVAPCCHVFGKDDTLERFSGPSVSIDPGKEAVLTWKIPATEGQPVLDVGIALKSGNGDLIDGVIYLDYLRWDGAPEVTFRRPAQPGEAWQRAWVSDADSFTHSIDPFRLSQGPERGLAIQGAREWRNYRVRTRLTPHLGRSWGLAAHVQGLKRYYAVVFESDDKSAGGTTVRLVRMRDTESVLATAAFQWSLDQSYDIELSLKEGHIEILVDGHLLLQSDDDGLEALRCGAIALHCEEGAISTEEITITSVENAEEAS